MVLLAATMTVGLLVGVVAAGPHLMPGLRRSDDPTFVAAFQAIDKAIINPWGMASFLGAPVLQLRAAGGRPSQPRGAGVGQLTISERRVAELAAEGHSNPEIAQGLFVTRKTVETHLGHAYRKLEVSRRGQLARALAQQTPPAGR